VLPYINLPELNLFGLPIHWFGILVATAVLIGIWLARWRAPKHGIDRDKLESFINWMLAGGFLGAHVLDTIFYHPEELLRRPWSLLFIWEGLSSFGGFVGALCGILLWRKFRAKGEPLLPYADLILSVFPISWIFGRAGCAVVHDHKGKLADEPNLLTVAFPDGPHYDLGLLEMFYAIFISAVVISLWRRPRPVGTYAGVTAILYAPIRFMLDFLRVSTGPTGDPRYFGLTPAQWASVGLLVLGVMILTRALSRRPPSDA
jgi:phosphatidylglycerol---prolipoprotein diacylglyceryl transferase